ncbi:MAG: hypothetical protein Q9227_006145 [Pyrenula ochraceoflavens]
MSVSDSLTLDADETRNDLIRSLVAPAGGNHFHGPVSLVVVHKAVQINRGGTGNQGLANMTPALTQTVNGDPPPSIDENPPVIPQTLTDTRASSRAPTPDYYILQTANWFKPGRFFRIWAPGDHEIHDKFFILLDSQNNEGKGVLVVSLKDDSLIQFNRSSATSRTHMALRRSKSADTQASSQGKEKFKSIYMDDDTLKEVLPDTYIFLEHTYNIPFFKYKCEDYGMLDDDSLEDLHFQYVQYLIKEWHLGKKMKEAYGP